MPQKFTKKNSQKYTVFLDPGSISVFCICHFFAIFYKLLFYIVFLRSIRERARFFVYIKAFVMRLSYVCAYVGTFTQ